MLGRCLDKTFNLLSSNKHFSKGMILSFAKFAPEEVKEMFLYLFDESKDIFERIENFKNKSDYFLKKYGNNANKHFQNENTISIYLWLYYPEKYYIYKFNEISEVSRKLESKYNFKKGNFDYNFQNFLKFYDEINNVVKEDSDLIELFRSQLSDSCYHDPELKILTADICFYINKYYQKQNFLLSNSIPFYGSNYDPGLSVDDWSKLLKNRKVFKISSLEIMKRIKDCGNTASCTQLSLKYGKTVNFYNAGSSALAKRICKFTGISPDEREDGEKRWWTVLYTGRNAEKNEEGSFIWKLREELSIALDKEDMSKINLYSDSFDEREKLNYWFLKSTSNIFISPDNGGNNMCLHMFCNDNGNYKNFPDLKIDDLVIFYESFPLKQIVAIGHIACEKDGKNIFFKKDEELTSPINYSYFKDLKFVKNFKDNQEGLFKISKDEYDFIINIVRKENSFKQIKIVDKYDKKNFLSEVYIDENFYNKLLIILKNKKNIILQGAPGVGKTFAAKRLAWSIMGEKDDSCIEFVQFHQNYSYEDFVIGYKPVDNGFELKDGIFYRFCHKAKNYPDKTFFFIIDEINRGNMSKIFGELLMLIENDYRDTKLTLAYGDISFSVPKNLFIIGMMNTADRSLAMIDYALRRRFSFFEIEPGFDSNGFKDYQKKLNNKKFDNLIIEIKKLNDEISIDKSLGKGFCIGHSYFCNIDFCTEEKLLYIIECDILPTLSEYWFDDEDKFRRWENSLKGVINDQG